MDRFPQIHGSIPVVFVGLVLLLVLPLACGPEGETVRVDRSDARTEHRTASGTGTAAPEGGPEGRPNVVLILADDLDRSVFEGSTLDTAWTPEGTTFENAVVTTSLCCPSRATIFRGQYAHNTGLVNNINEEPGGGARFFRGSGLEEETLATLLQDGGYETWFGGKYLNGYEDAGGWEGYVPPGWDSWQAYLNESFVNREGTVVGFDGHYTDWLSGEASRFIETQRASARPFFMQIGAWDTHSPLLVPERHRDAYPHAQAPKPPSFNEADVSDKPDWVAEKSALRQEEIARFDRIQAARMRSALTLEDLSREVVSALSRTDQLDDTYVIFTSDNGYHMGLHRIRGAKWTPYNEAHEVPFVVRGPEVPRGKSFDDLVTNTDIAPTVLDLAGLTAPGWMDGRSFAPFLDGTAPETWRSSVLIEGVNGTYYDRPGYSGVRREDEVYVEYSNGGREYYDLARDPYQLENRPEAAPQTMKEDLQALKNCSGDACRRAEGF
ncbi:MAG: sulfatase [Actinomycetota bacterium]|nr:sulfatase [Actinomycetota bacterium]